MRRRACDILVLGAGFAGSLIAVIARRLGLETVLIERDHHPRFAIGESSTPLANFKLQALARAYDLQWLAPLAKYGAWKKAQPEMTCGLKRGFSFFHHQRGRAFRPAPDHSNELMVTASPSPELGDTHWFRAEFDAFLVGRAEAAGVHYIDTCDVSAIERKGAWRVAGTTPAEAVEIDAALIIDATGGGGALSRALRIEPATDALATSSRAIYGHFLNVSPWDESYEAAGGVIGDHPFPADASALHHVFEGGWMWQLRFDNGVTSAGLSLDPARCPLDERLTPEEEWAAILDRLPSIRRQFDRAAPVRPLVRTGRLQRRVARAVGADWILLPHAAAFVDPWLSSGVALTLYGVERAARIMADFAPAISARAIEDNDPLRRRLAAYERSLFREVALMDRVSSAGLARFDSFAVVAATTMVYFAAATYAEERFRRGEGGADDEFLLAHDERFRAMAHGVCDRALSVSPVATETFAEDVARAIEPYNRVGLCDVAARNMYAYREATRPSDGS